MEAWRLDDDDDSGGDDVDSDDEYQAGISLKVGAEGYHAKSRQALGQSMGRIKTCEANLGSLGRRKKNLNKIFHK